ncbi:VCBS domain-containing protein, partial [Neptuniibacter sp.]|uniref:VCBS domain-containing protein n=1 Tax=Neptuniibacter sp. TaxID=1962643 RepID=UPI00263793DE
TELSGSYGTLNIQSNGDYTYTLDNANIDVNALAAGESLDDIFTYTLQDADGSVTHALITITVNGVDEPVITITDSNDTADGDITTQEGVEISAASFTIEAADGLSLLTISGTDITAAELLAASTTPIAVTTARGTLTVTDYNDSTGEVQYNYISSSVTPIDHSEGDAIDSISITVTDSNARATTDTLEILIEDSASIAEADSNSIEEKPASNTVTGNAITDSEGADQLSYDTPSVVSGLAVGDTDADLVDASTVGTELSGSYGTLNIQSNGDYTYTLDNANIDVNALAAGESLDDLFTYTLQDADGSVTHALITITVNGVDEPVITITDSNDTADGDITTQEGVEISAASFTIEAADGLSLLTIAGTDITAAELLAASTTPIAVTTARGTLTITDYNDATGVVQYNYLSSSATPIDHREGDPLDSISITVTDNNARATTDTLEILIEDSASIAVPDSNNIDEKPLTDTVMGNAITDATGADQLSYDTPSVIVGIAVGDTGSDLIDAGTINTDITGTYGTLSIQSNGDYTYTIDTSNSEVNALNRGESLSDIFTYTLQDADGSLSNTTITITIDGVSEPIVTIEDSNAETDGDITIAETSSGITSSFIALAEDGLDSISISGTDITLAQLLDAENNPIAVTSSLGTITITGYDSSTGETNYEYTLLSAPLDHSSGPILDAFIITTTDVNTRTASDVLDISIDDSVPDAQPDSNDIEETSESGLVTGNLITGPNTPDILSMDGEHEVVGLASGYTMATLNDPTTLDTQVVGTYGTLQVQADGSYTYVLDQSNAVVNSLQDGMTLLDSFTYTITDDDGSLDYTTVDITVIGIDIPPTADLSIPTRVELPENSRLLNNSFTFTAAEGLSTVTVNGNDLTPADLEAINSNAITLDTDTGELTLTAYDEATRTITYDFVPRLDSSPEGDTAATITFTVTDILDYTATSSYEVTIIRPVYDDPLQAEQLRPEILEKLSGQEAFVGFAVVEQSPLSEYRSLTPDIDHLLFGAEQDQGLLDTRPNADQLFEVPESIALEHELQVVRVFNSAFDKIMKEVEAEENNINPIGSAITVPQMLSGPSIVSGEAFNYRIPPNTFSHTDSSSELAYQAEIADGQDLPQWLNFNAETGVFSGKAPADFSGELEIKVMASDAAGRQVETTLIIQINPDDNLTSFQGKAGLSEQLQSQNVFAWKQNQDQLAALSKALNELSTARESEV